MSNPVDISSGVFGSPFNESYYEETESVVSQAMTAPAVDQAPSRTPGSPSRWYTPVGAINGSNRVFTLPFAPGDPSQILVIYNSSVQTDYQVLVTTLTVNWTPQAGDQLIVFM